jgi:peptide/nickel transport system substrate-binding protein
MPVMFKRLLPAALAVMLVSLLSACGGTSSANQPGPSNTVIMAGDISDAVTLDPQVAYEFSSTAADQLMYSTLVRFPYGDLSTPKPNVASSWDTSSDGKTWTFHLKPNITFSSGNTLTADDVVYTFERLVNLPNDPASWLITQAGFTPDNVDQNVKALDPSTVQITLPQIMSQGAWLSILANSVAGIVDSKVVKAHVQNGDWGTHWLYNNSAGSGPYTLQTWTKGVEIDFASNPHFALRPAPKIIRVVWKNASDTSARLDMLQRGDADIAEGLSADQIASLQGNSNIKVLKVPQIAMQYIGLGVNTVPAFGNPNVREAMKYAIDYNAIVNQLLHGNGEPLQGIIPRGIFGYSATPSYSLDIAKAKSLMAQGGYPNGFTCTMLIPAGTVAGGIQAADLAQVIKSDLAQIGVTVNIRQVESSELYTEYRAHKAEMVLAEWAMDYPDPQDFAAPFADYTQQSLIWRLQDNDATLSKLVQQAAALPNNAQRAALYQQINTDMATGPFVVMYQPDAVVAYRSNITNLTYDDLNGVDYPIISK